MKTAEELFLKHHIIIDGCAVLSPTGLKKILKEYDSEVKKIIEDMIKRKSILEIEKGWKVNKGYHTQREAGYCEALTELKEKL